MADLRTNFVGIQKTDAGTEVKMRFVDGAFRPEPQLNPGAPLVIPTSDWVRLRAQTRGSLVHKVMRKGLSLTRCQVETEVDVLLAGVDAEPAKRHWNPVIGEGFEQVIASGGVRVTQEFFPWETEWCLAKIAFELSCVAWPKDYRMYYQPAREFFKQFLRKRSHDPASKTGTGIFVFSEIKGAPAKEHTVSFLLAPTKLEYQITLFGGAQWRWQASAKPINAPPGNGWSVIIRNPLSDNDASIQCLPL